MTTIAEHRHVRLYHPLLLTDGHEVARATGVAPGEVWQVIGDPTGYWLVHQPTGRILGAWAFDRATDPAHESTLCYAKALQAMTLEAILDSARESG